MAAVAGDMNSQAFWNEFMRRPDAKAAYQAERRLQEKKMAWAEERRYVETRGEQRKIVGAALEAAPADIKKLISPMFHMRVVEQFLWMVYDECDKKGTKFLDKLRDDQTMSHLRKLRENFQEGGEERLAELENHWYSVCNSMAEEEQAAKEKEQQPRSIDIHTLKQVLEFGQECKREGNTKFKEGLYEEALAIYSQGDDVMKKWKVEKHLKQEHQWLKEYHLVCLKNKAQAALKLERYQTALDASDAALRIEPEDHKAWYRKVLAEKCLGHFEAAEESLARLEEVAETCQDRRTILRDCEAERKRIHAARSKHKAGTKDMLDKAFEAGVFGASREPEEAQPAQVADAPVKRLTQALKPLERSIHLTAALAGELLDELSEAYEGKSYQETVRKCAFDSGWERSVFLTRLQKVAFGVQRPVLEKWGFEGSDQGVREMQAAIREHTNQAMPDWLKAKQRRCLEGLYGGKESGMMDILL